LNQIPSIARPAIGRRGPEYAVAGQKIAQGEFRGLARWMTGPYASRTPVRLTDKSPAAGIDAQGEDPRDGSDSLGALLAAIDDDVERHAAAARDGVMTDFAARVAHARKHLSPHLLAAALATIKEQRKAALALIKRNAAMERAGRKKAVIDALGGKGPRRSNKWQNPHGAPPPPNL
jgi:hypothetical protein